ncbi:MAG TPA: CRISPR-associated endonuclease Cas2 [Thermoanaerobaculia bacterium]|nr:CRISPR-associated endonuclease Cas2 [Thermoanaerobaculia bacterium]
MDLFCYLVTYDISCPRRWRQVFKTLHGFGEHVQLSVFRCDLTPERHARLRSALDRLIKHDEDQVLIAKLGRSTSEVIDGIVVLGRPRQFSKPGPTIV